MAAQQVAELGDVQVQVQLQLAWLALPGAGGKVAFLEEAGVGLSREVAFGYSKRFTLHEICESGAAMLNTVWPSETKVDDEVVLDAVVTFLWGRDIQLDINAGAGLNDASDNFVGFGMAARF